MKSSKFHFLFLVQICQNIKNICYISSINMNPREISQFHFLKILQSELRQSCKAKSDA